MNQCIGTCSICGGQVMSYVGAWMSIAPPPPPTCSQCGAVAAGRVREVIPMVPAPPPRAPAWFSITFVDDPLKQLFSHGMTLFYDWPPKPISDGKWRA